MKGKINFKKLIFIVIPLLVATLMGLFFADFTPNIALADAGYDYQSDAPYETFTAGPQGSIVTTQTAYMPVSRISLSGEYEYGALNAPEDMIVDKSEGRVYIADTGNKRVVVTGLDGKVLTVIGEGVLSQPTGLAIGNGYLFVCDKTNKLVYIYDKSTYELATTIDRPDNPLVGANTPYVPTKITVDSRGNMYLVSEGCVSGLMQINMEGEFVGYVGCLLNTSPTPRDRG